MARLTYIEQSEFSKVWYVFLKTDDSVLYGRETKREALSVQRVYEKNHAND